MNTFSADTLFEAVKALQLVTSSIDVSKTTAEHFVATLDAAIGQKTDFPQLLAPEGLVGGIQTLLNGALKACADAGFTDAEDEIRTILKHIEERHQDYSSLRVELTHALECLFRELKRRTFLAVVPSRSAYVDNPALFGQAVPDAFPSAMPDLIQAGNCLAADCNTAAVFHLMRGVEWGLRALCANVGIKRVKSKIKKSGRITYTPIEYTEWEKILDELQEHVDAKLKTLKRGTTKQELQGFYYPALQDIRGIRDAWRNHVMHTRAEYTGPDADAILSHVKRLLSTLATKVKEV